jgi:magnesium chelatase subunit I
VRTHYPLRLDDELALMVRQESLLWQWDERLRPARRARLPRRGARPLHPHAVREAPQVDQRSGVSARLAIAAAETVAASAPSGALPSPASCLRSPGSSTCASVVPRSRGKVEFDALEEGREEEVLAAPAAPGDRRDVPRPLPGSTSRACRSGFEAGTVETGELLPGSALLAALGTIPGLAAAAEPAGRRGFGVAGSRRGSAVEFAMEGLHLHRAWPRRSCPAGRSTGEHWQRRRLPLRAVGRRT